MSARRSDAGFTLVEVLVSLAIFSLAIVGLNRAGALAVSGTAELQQRLHAGFAADNAVVLAKTVTLEGGTTRASAESGGLVFDVATTIAETDVAGFYEIVVTVAREDAEQVLASRRGFHFDPPERLTTEDETP